MFLNWKVADHETLGLMNCKAGSPPMTHLVLTLQDRGAIQPRQHTETDPSSAIHQECSGIRNVRLTVRRVLEALAILSCRAELKREYPELEDEDIRQALAFAAALIDHKVLPLPHTSDGIAARPGPPTFSCPSS